MANMTVNQRTQFDRVDLSVPTTGVRVRNRRPLIVYTVIAAAVLAALVYATVGRDRRLGAGDRPRRDHADRGRRDDRRQPRAPRLAPARRRPRGLGLLRRRLGLGLDRLRRSAR